MVQCEYATDGACVRKLYLVANSMYQSPPYIHIVGAGIYSDGPPSYACNMTVNAATQVQPIRQVFKNNSSEASEHGCMESSLKRNNVSLFKQSRKFELPSPSHGTHDQAQAYPLAEIVTCSSVLIVTLCHVCHHTTYKRRYVK